MTFDWRTDRYTLASGRTVYAYGGVLGLGPDAISASYGWDGSVDMHDGLPFTTVERHEIAAEMIRRWEWWRENPIHRISV